MPLWVSAGRAASAALACSTEIGLVRSRYCASNFSLAKSCSRPAKLGVCRPFCRGWPAALAWAVGGGV